MPVNINYNTLIGLNPTAIVSYFKSKDIVLKKDFQDRTHATAFTMARALTRSVLSECHSSLVKAMDEGTPFNEWKNAFMRGKNEQSPFESFTKNYLRTVYNTNVNTSYSAARYTTQIENAENRPYLQYCAIVDDRTRHGHLMLNKKTFKISDPIWKTIYPPKEWGCRCWVRSLNKEEFAKLVNDNPDSIQKPTDAELTQIEGSDFQFNPEAITFFSSKSATPVVPVNAEKTLSTNSPKLPDSSAFDFGAKISNTTQELNNQLGISKKEYNEIQTPAGSVMAIKPNVELTASEINSGDANFTTAISSTLTSPQEVWLNKLEDSNGRTIEVRNFISFFKDPKSEKETAIVLSFDKFDNMTFRRFTQPKLNEVDAFRAGRLIRGNS